MNPVHILFFQRKKAIYSRLLFGQSPWEVLLAGQTITLRIGVKLPWLDLPSIISLKIKLFEKEKELVYPAKCTSRKN